MDAAHRWTMASVIIPILIMLVLKNVDGGHHSPCRNYKECNVSENLICDKESKVCVCPLNNYYDLDQERCVAEVDHRCTLETETNPPFVHCVKNAKCVKRSGLAMNQGICECETGYGPTRYGFCENVKAPDYQPFVKRSSAATSTQIPILVTIFSIGLVLATFLDVF